MASTTAATTNANAGPALDNRRIAAAAIDVAAPVLAGVALLVSGLLTPAVALVLAGWTLFYFFALESGGGQTVGKRAMNLRVVSAEGGGEPTMQQYGTRTIARVVDMPVIGLLVMLGTGERRQRLGDIAGHTSVVDAQAQGEVVDAFDAAQLHAQPVALEAAPAAEAPAKPKRSRPGLGGPELKLPSFGRSKATKAPKQPKPAKDASGRKTLGGPELKMPSFGRSKAPKAPKAAKAPVVAEAATAPDPVEDKPGRKTLGGPELKLPSFGRSKAPKAPKAPKAAKPAKEKSGRKTLGGPELKMPSFGRKKQPPVVMPDPEPAAPAAPQPVPAAPEPAAREPEPPAAPEPAQPPIPAIKAFDPFAADAPQPSVEVVGHGTDEPEPDPEPPAPEVMQRDVPDVEIVRDDPVPEPPAPEPMRPSIPAVPPPPAEERLPAAAQQDPEPEPAPAPEPEPEPEHVEGIRDDGSSRVHVKPIETVSAMELLMREAQEQDQHSS